MTTNHHPNPQSICIFRLSAIGDVTHVVPVVKTIQNQFPNCKVTWVIGQLEHQLLKGLPGVEFIVFSKSKGKQGVLAFKQQLFDCHFDVLLQMQLSFRANLLSRYIKANRKIGFDWKRSKELHSLFINERIPYLHHCHVLDGFMQFAEQLGCKKKLYQWDIPVSESDQDVIFDWVDRDRKTVVISPCSSHQLRNWSVERYSQLVNLLIEKYAVQVILTGSPAQRELDFVAAIESSCLYPVNNVAGKDTLKQLLCLLKQADLVISPDSGPLHMAGAVNTPVIGLLAASNYLRSGSYQFPDLTVNKYPEACKKYFSKTPDQVKWGRKTEFPGAMDLITVEDVAKKVSLVLSKK